MPGQIATPVRLGRARQGLFSPMLPELAGLDAERIVQVPACLWHPCAECASLCAGQAAPVAARPAGLLDASRQLPLGRPMLSCALLVHARMRWGSCTTVCACKPGPCCSSEREPRHRQCRPPWPPPRPQVCAGRYMSAALTAAGEVWAWGGGFNGELGSPSLSWSPGPRRVDGILAEASPRSLPRWPAFCLPGG